MIVADIIRALEQYPWDARVVVRVDLPCDEVAYRDAEVAPHDESKPPAGNLTVRIVAS